MEDYSRWKRAFNRVKCNKEDHDKKINRISIQTLNLYCKRCETEEENLVDLAEGVKSLFE